MNTVRKANEHPERRVRQRKSLNSPAWADPGGILPVIDCKIIDVSDEGARIIAPSGIDIPEIFQLQIDSKRILGAAEVVWREQNLVGVKFLTKL